MPREDIAQYGTPLGVWGRDCCYGELFHLHFPCHRLRYRIGSRNLRDFNSRASYGRLSVFPRSDIEETTNKLG